jgi:hypothetical protein
MSIQTQAMLDRLRRKQKLYRYAEQTLGHENAALLLHNGKLRETSVGRVRTCSAGSLTWRGAWLHAIGRLNIATSQNKRANAMECKK